MSSPAELLSESKLKKERSIGSDQPRERRQIVWNCHLKKKRSSLQLSLKEVADANGISVSTIFVAESGVDLRLITAHKLANFFGCEIKDLWEPLTCTTT